MLEMSFCTQCGQRIPKNSNFCPYCGSRLAPAVPQNVSVPVVMQVAPAPKNPFYVFAVQGPAFGSAPGGDIVLEKAQKLMGEFEPAKEMELKLVRPSMWSARVQTGGGSGMVSVSYSMDGFTNEIHEYLKKEGVPDELIHKGIALSEEHSLQLSNPMSGVFVMGIPILPEETPAQAAAESPAEATAPAEEPAPVPEVTAPAPEPAGCAHEYKHYVCVKCGAMAPKPQLPALGIRPSGQYTYEYYRAGSAEEAKCFLQQTEVTKPLYYVMVETPEGKWGRDKDGMFLEGLCPFQLNLSLAQCEATTALFPDRMQDLQMAAQKITDNYLLSLTCGSCGYGWTDGVAYRAKTVVKCPECGKFNLVDTDHIHFNNL